jgi:hypothetical protein
MESPTPQLTLTLPITRPDLAAWLTAIPDDQRNQQAEQALAVGHQVLTLIQASASDAAMQQFFRPVLDKMGQLDTSLQAMLAGVQKSQRLGDIGERMVQSQLRATFPNDQFSIISDSGHQADLLATFDLGGGQSRDALVEVKLYTNDVPAGELDKFRRDLSEQRQRYGLMVSLTSRLTGIHAPYAIEATADYVALFVPNAGADGVRLYWGAALLKALMQFELQASRRLRGEAIEQAWGRLQVELGELDKATSEVGKLREAAVRLRKSMQDGLDDLVAQVMAAEVRLKHMTGRLSLRLHEELQALPTAEVGLDLPAPASPDELTAFLFGLDTAKDKRAAGYRMVLDSAIQLGLQIGIRGDELVVERGERCVAVTASTKTEVRLRFSPVDGEVVTFLPGVEDWNKGAVELKVKDAAVVLERLLVRAGQV